MGIGKLIEEVGGAIAAEQAAEAVDPNAGVFVKGAAIVAGFVGADKLSDALEAHAAAGRQPAPTAVPAAPQAAADADSDDTPPEPT